MRRQTLGGKALSISAIHKFSNLSNLLSVFGDKFFSWNYVDRAIIEQIHLQSGGLATRATKHDDPC